MARRDDAVTEWGPGVAFIRWRLRTCSKWREMGSPEVMRYFGVPRGYIWAPATIGTAAGWVRPMGTTSQTEWRS